MDPENPAFRHAKAIGPSRAGIAALGVAGYAGGEGVLVDDEAASVVVGLLALVAQHRAWPRVPGSV